MSETKNTIGHFVRDQLNVFKISTSSIFHIGTVWQKQQNATLYVNRRCAEHTTANIVDTLPLPYPLSGSKALRYTTIRQLSAYFLGKTRWLVRKVTDLHWTNADFSLKADCSLAVIMTSGRSIQCLIRHNGTPDMDLLLPWFIIFITTTFISLKTH